MRSVRSAPVPAALPPVGSVGNVIRVRIAREIIAAYIPLSRQLRTNDLNAMVAAARTPAGPRISVPAPNHHLTSVRLGQMIRKVFRVLPMDDRCLIRALVLTRMLEQRRIETRIVIGVNLDDGFAAHAWVEHDGYAVLPAGRHAPLTSL